MNPADEIVLIVDEQNQEVAQVSRRVMREGGLIHRACYILVFNRSQEIFVQRRTMSKDIYPGYLDVATGGVVLAGESYELSAKRELAEELGVRKVALTSHFDFYHEADNNRVWGRSFPAWPRDRLFSSPKRWRMDFSSASRRCMPWPQRNNLPRMA